MIRILVIAHGELSREIVRTAEMIVGKQEQVEVLSLSSSDSLATLCQRTGDILNRIDTPDGTLIVTDMLGGTPCNASLPFSTTHKIEIVSGMNLYMLLSAFMNRPGLPLDELARKVITDGQKNIANVKEIFLGKLK